MQGNEEEAAKKTGANIGREDILRMTSQLEEKMRKANGGVGEKKPGSRRGFINTFQSLFKSSSKSKQSQATEPAKASSSKPEKQVELVNYQKRNPDANLT